jgi:hypothetical protein
VNPRHDQSRRTGDDAISAPYASNFKLLPIAEDCFSGGNYAWGPKLEPIALAYPCKTALVTNAQRSGYLRDRLQRNVYA